MIKNHCISIHKLFAMKNLRQHGVGCSSLACTITACDYVEVLAHIGGEIKNSFRDSNHNLPKNETF